jgi:hypothetical protein
MEHPKTTYFVIEYLSLGRMIERRETKAAYLPPSMLLASFLTVWEE